MKREIVRIDDEKCNGCGICVPACAEGAIQIVDGKAKLVSDVYCDGLGACLGECPEDAITIEVRDAKEFDEEAVKKLLLKQARDDATESREKSPNLYTGAGSFCPSARLMNLGEEKKSEPSGPAPLPVPEGDAIPSQLTHWPIKLKLVPPVAPFLKDKDLFLIADCVPFAFTDVHRKFLSKGATVIGCPKFDENSVDFEKLTAILRESDVRSLTVVHVEVPCCFGYWQLGQEALKASGKNIPLKQVVVGIRGELKEEKEYTAPVNQA